MKSGDYLNQKWQTNLYLHHSQFVYILFVSQYDLSILKHLFFIKYILFIAVSFACIWGDACLSMLLEIYFSNIKFCKYFLFPNVIQGDETKE